MYHRMHAYLGVLLFHPVHLPCQIHLVQILPFLLESKYLRTGAFVAGFSVIYHPFDVGCGSVDFVNCVAVLLSVPSLDSSKEHK